MCTENFKKNNWFSLYIDICADKAYVYIFQQQQTDVLYYSLTCSVPRIGDSFTLTLLIYIYDNPRVI